MPRPRIIPKDAHTLERLKIEKNDHQRLQTLSRNTGATMTWIRRQALKQYLDQQFTKQP